MTLAALSTEDGIRLIAAVVGADRAADQAGPLDRIATACGGFPLALRIAAARLAGRPGWQFARLAGRLDDEGQRLRELRMGDVEARAGFIFSYRHLDAHGQRLYRLLGVANLSDFPLWVPAALLDVSPTEAEGHLDRLVDANLLVAGSDVPRYQLHDLLRVFARERAEEEAAQERFAALERLCAAAFALADASDRRLSAGNSATWDRPLDWSLSIPAAELVATGAPGPAWFDLERANLLAMMALAHRSGHRPWVWRLAGAMWQYLEYSSRWGDWRAAFELALRSAREEGDARAESSSL